MRNDYRIEDGIAYISCTFEGKTVEALIDENKLDIAESYPLKWYVKRSSKDHYYVTGVMKRGGKQRVIYLHRLLTDCPEGKVVDHINHNTIDNRMCNLRVVTHQVNIFNTKSQKGVKFRKDLGKWRVRMLVDGKEMFFGYYSRYEEALAVRKEAERKYRKEA
ncbi:HNH endonuclease signature motif containing protein [Cytobacillus sp. FSL R7-0696]|uniref:HNH endonuclease signature motif containing protein n=1 Tax=Cytobacillus sp. FSL R7-0696 TaxID=2921691 RepID=UPI0030FCD595